MEILIFILGFLLGGGLVWFFFNKNKQDLTQVFKSISADTLHQNNQSFLHLAQTAFDTLHEKAKGDLDKKQQAIDDLVKPVRESLQKFEVQVQNIEKARVGAYEGLSSQIQSLLQNENFLRQETSKIARALSSTKTRGRWGEIQLKRVVELAGMVSYCDFTEQTSVTTSDGALLRPDLVVQLPGGKKIVVDAKSPMSAYMEAMETTDEALKTLKLKDHVQALKNHIQALGKKSYWEQFQPAPEFVVLFLPGESFLTAALEIDPHLMEESIERRVILSTPATLIAILRAVAFGWRQEKMNQNAEDVSKLGRELYNRLALLSSYFSKLGDGLTKAVDQYNQAIGAFETRVLVSARRLDELCGAQSGTENLESPKLVDRLPRSLKETEKNDALN